MKTKEPKNILFVLILIFSLSVTLYCQLPLILNKYAINDDIRQTIYPYLRYQDKELFKDDLITDFYYKKNPWGLNMLYFLISHFCDPIKFTKFCPFLLCPLAALYLLKLGSLLRNNLTGIIASILFVFVSWNRNVFSTFGTGDGADFAVPLLAIFLYYSLQDDFLKIFIVLIILALFYPPVLLICLLAYAISATLDLLENVNKQKLASSIGLLLAALPILFFNYSSRHLVLIGMKDMINMEEFYAGGRTPVFFNSIYEQLTNYQSGLAFDFSLSFLSLFAILLIIFLRKKTLNLPRQLWYFMLVSLSLFIIANATMYKLYGPSRYMRYSLPIFLIMFISLNTSRLIELIKPKLTKYVVSLILISLTAVYFMPRMQRYYIVADQPQLYNFLQSLPKNVFLAGHPTFMNNIPTFAKRKVLINEETSEPYYTNYYSVIKARTYDFFNAYYSDSPKLIFDFCKKYNITHIIVCKSDFSKDCLERGEFYLEPFNDYIKNLIKNKNRFALMEIPETEKIFDENDIFVIKIRNNHFWEQS